MSTLDEVVEDLQTLQTASIALTVNGATWQGEGGGVLLNQCLHNLDLWQWIFGMPRRLRAFCGFGRHHEIEVEDEVTAYLEYESGATGVLVTSTGEAPGTNRLEVAGDRGKVVIEGGAFAFTRNELSTAEFSRTAREPFSAPPVLPPVIAKVTVCPASGSLALTVPTLVPSALFSSRVKVAGVTTGSALGGRTVIWKVTVGLASTPPLAVPPSSLRVTLTVAVPVCPAAGV